MADFTGLSSRTHFFFAEYCKTYLMCLHHCFQINIIIFELYGVYFYSLVNGWVSDADWNYNQIAKTL